MDGNSVHIQIVAADCPAILTALNQARIPVQDVHRVDDLTIRFRIASSDLKKAQTLANKRGGKLKVLRSASLPGAIRSFVRRPLLIFGLLLIAIATLFLPTRVLFIQVEGNVNIPGKWIMESAKTCGITFGASRREIRSERVKNQLLETLPQLQWVGVNTYGCTAVISVRERAEESKVESQTGVTSMVASTDGIITSCTATKGNLVCKIGQAVKAGQTLISGYTDCGISIRAERSEGEVYAQTLQNLRVIIPTDWDQKGETTLEKKKYSVIIGKKRINFYQDSGILDTTCDKMYTEHVLTLPGGFPLPLVLLVEKQVYRNVQQTNAPVQDVSGIAKETAENYLRRQMISGTILSSQFTEEFDDGVYVLLGQYRCLEMIGRMRSEEIIESNGENH